MAVDVMRYIFFSAGYCFSQEFLCMFFSSRNQSAGYFFLKSPITPSKVKQSALKIHQTFAQLILICQSFLKPFETIEDKTLQGRGEESFLLSTTRRVRTDGRTLTSKPKFLGWIVYQIFLPMVLCCTCFARPIAPRLRELLPLTFWDEYPDMAFFFSFFFSFFFFFKIIHGINVLYHQMQTRLERVLLMN